MTTLLAVARANRALMLSRDAALLAQLRAYYAVARRDLMRDLDNLIAQIEARQADGQEISRAWLLRQDRYVSLIQQIDHQVQGFADYAAPRILIAQSAAAQLGVTHAGQMLEVSIGVAFDRLPVSAVSELVGTLQDGSPLRAYFDGFGAKASQAGREVLVSGLVRGKNPRAVAPELMRALDTSATRALQLARNEGIRPYRTAALETYKQNSDVLDGWIWLASLSPRTCPVCWSLHGSRHPLSEDFASHSCCRCSPAPSVRGMTLDIQTGPVAFDALDAEVQQTILGKQAQAAYAKGQFKLSELVGHTHSDRWGDGLRTRSLREVLAS